jgi:predicted enzyme related to lactoylglutathione lyase
VSSTIINVTFDCADPRALAGFWSALTGWPATDNSWGDSPEWAVASPGQASLGQASPRLYFVKVPEGKTVKNRLHLDVIPADRTQDAEIARLTGLGASVVSDRRPEIGWVVLADPEGNEFCVEMSAAELEAAKAAESAE